MKTQPKSIWRGIMVPIVALISMLVAYWFEQSKRLGQDAFDIWMMATLFVFFIWEVWCYWLDKAEPKAGEER
jgi:uncharacterized membrane protein